MKEELVKDVVRIQELAKSLWGHPLDPLSPEAREINKNYSGGGVSGTMTTYKPGSGGDWKHHLERLVTSDDPAKYLEKHI